MRIRLSLTLDVERRRPDPAPDREVQLDALVEPQAPGRIGFTTIPGPVERRVRGGRVSGLGWWAISGDALLEALRRAHDGEDPDVVYAELYANSDHENVPGEDG